MSYTNWLLARLTCAVQCVQHVLGKPSNLHLRTGREGETAAYLFLRQQGYRIVATNFRTRADRGEIDLIGWENDVLCFVEVKTRIGEGLTLPEAAVDTAKKSHIRSVARSYLRRLRVERTPPCRFDIVSVYYAQRDATPEIRLIRNAFRWRSPRPHPFMPMVGSSRSGRWQPRR